jgi:hypothetical protein
LVLSFEPVAFLRRLAPLIPPPWAHLVRHYGLFAPNAGDRDLLPAAPVSPGGIRIDPQRRADRTALSPQPRTSAPPASASTPPSTPPDLRPLSSLAPNTKDAPTAHPQTDSGSDTRRPRTRDAGTGTALSRIGSIRIKRPTERPSSARARRLFLTFPFSHARKLESTIRRLLQPSPGKQDAILYDYDDPRVAPLHRAFEKRRAFLTRLGREADEAMASEALLHLPV